jgi:TP901 family phage tail tape measure protein
MLRVGNFASRPLRQAEADFARLGKASEAATASLARLDAQRKRLEARRAQALTTQARYLPGGADFEKLQASQATRVARNLENQRSQLAAISRAEERITTLNRLRYDQETRILRIQEQQKRIAAQLRDPQTSAARQAQLRQMQVVNTRRMISAQSQLEENAASIAAANTQIEKQNRLLIKSKAEQRGFGDVFSAENAKMAESAAKAGREVNYLTDQLNLNAAAQERAARAMKQANWDAMAQKLDHFGRIAQYVGGGVVVAMGLMAKASADFQTEATNAATQVGDSFKGIQEASKVIQHGILEQMERFPASAQDMAKSAYQIYSSITLLGRGALQTRRGLYILALANKAAVAGNTDLADSTQTVIRLFNVFGHTTHNFSGTLKQVKDALDATFSVVRTGAFSFQEFSQMLINSAPIAKNSGQSLTELGGALAFLSRQLGPRGAAVSYARLLEFIQKAEPGLKKAGVATRDAMGHMLPLSQILGEMRKHFKGLVEGKESVVEWAKQITKGTGAGTQGTAQMRRALIPLLKSYREYEHELSVIEHRHGLFNQSFQAMYQSAGVQFKLFQNQLKATALIIGAAAIPAFMKILKPIKDLIMWFTNLDDSTKKNIGQWATWIGVITLVSGTIAVVSSVIMRIFGPLTTMAKLLGNSRVAALLLRGEFSKLALAETALWGVFGIGLLLYLKYPKVFHEITKAVGGTKNAIELLALALAYVKFASFINGLTAVTTGAEAATGAVTGLRGALLGLGGVRLGAMGAIVALLTRFGAEAPAIKDAIAVLQGKDPFAAQGSKSGTLAAQSVIKATQGSDAVRKLMYHPNTIGKRVAGMFGYNTPYDVIEAYWAGKVSQKVFNSFVRTWFKADPTTARRILGHTATMTDFALDPARAPHDLPLGGGIRSNIPTTRDVQTQLAKHRATAQVAHNKSVQDWIKLIVAADRYATKHAKDLKAQQRMEILNAELQKKFKGAELAAIQDVINAYLSGDKKIVDSAKKKQKERVDAHKKAVKQMQQDEQTAVQNMMNTYNQFLDANKAAFGDISTGVRVQDVLQWSGIPRFSDFMGDIKDQVRNFERWRKEIGQARKKLPKEMVAELQAQGLQGEPIIQGLLNLTPRQRQQYIAMWKRGQEDIKKATAVDFNSQLKDWRSHGRKSAIAFLKGMSDEQGWINREMRRIWTSWTQGGDRHLSTGHTRTTRHTGHTTVHNHNQITVHQGKEDLSTTLRKARHHQRQRARLATT